MSCAIIDDCLMAGIQEAAENILVDSVQIRRRNAIADGAGGGKPASGDGWPTINTVAGLLVTASRTPRERSIAEQTNAPVPYEIYFAHETDVRSQDRLVINSRTFQVQGVAKDEAIAILDKAYCVEMQK